MASWRKTLADAAKHFHDLEYKLSVPTSTIVFLYKRLPCDVVTTIQIHLAEMYDGDIYGTSRATMRQIYTMAREADLKSRRNILFRFFSILNKTPLLRIFLQSNWTIMHNVLCQKIKELVYATCDTCGKYRSRKVLQLYDNWTIPVSSDIEENINRMVVQTPKTQVDTEEQMKTFHF